MSTSENKDRLDFLLEKFLGESEEYKHIQIPENPGDRHSLLRMLMNVRPAKPLPEEVLKVQDEYLSDYVNAKGVVKISDIPLIKSNISIWQGDITRLKVDAIVNAANSQMLGCFIPLHSCIDNQIHTLAGVQLREECHQKMSELSSKFGQDFEYPTAVPLLTDAYNLPAKKIIHIVGPIVDGELSVLHQRKLKECYINILDCCLKNDIKSVAICCISTGVFCFPGERAAQIAIQTVSEWNEKHPNALEKIIFNVFKDEDREYYEKYI